MPARLHLFGSPTIDLGGGPAALPFERRSQLLVYLALKRAWVGRAELAAIFWPEQSQKLAFANLRKTLFRLQSVPWGRPIELEGQTARLVVASDVAEFEAALRDGRGDQALRHYAGDLLAGFDDASSEAWTSWLGFERDRLRAAWRGAVLQRAAGEVEATQAVALTGRLLEADPLDEAALRLHLQGLAQSGQGSRARQEYRAFVARLQEDLGLGPGADLQALHDSLVGTSAAASAPALPAAVDAEAGDDGFVGRSIERRRIAEMLGQGDCRLISLVGPGGVGKTRLARRLMAELSPDFSDGAVFVALEDAATPAELGSRLAREVGVELVGRTDPFEQAIESLRGLQLLLVLDNFEQLVAAAAQIETLISRCPRLRVLVTTRARLGIASEWTFPLEGLPLPEADDADHLETFDAVRLFVRAARRVEPTFAADAEPQALVDICRQVDGLPLALELAASWTRMLSCAAIAAELRQGSELLRAVDPARPARQASIEIVFDHAWKLLGPAERDALRRLSVFRGGFSAEAARAIAAPLPVLGALLDKSLLRKEESRFFLHPLLQRLAADRLTDADARAQAETAHAQFFHRLLAQMRRPVNDGDREALRLLDIEFDNGRAAWQHVRADAIPAVDLAGSARTLLHYCDHRGRFTEGVALLNEALAAPSADTPGLRPLLLALASHLLYRLDRYPEAIASATAGLAQAAAGADHDARLQCYNVLGSCSLRLGKFADARRYYRQALTQAPAEGDPHNAAAILDNLALVEKAMGRFDEALRMSTESLVQHRRIGHVAGEALCLNNLSTLQSDLGDYASALANARASLALCERHGLVGSRGYVLANLSELTLKLGELDAARGHAASALELALATGNRATEAAVRLSIVQIAVRQNDLPGARQALRESLELSLAIGRPLSLLAAIAIFTDLLAAQGERRAAARLLRFAMGHPAMTVLGRHQLQARLDALADEDAGEDEPPWSGAPLDELARRIVAETPAMHASLVAALRAGG